jgi:hypothetical protein
MNKTIKELSCPSGWIEKEHIGRGAFSDIWKACCGDNCNFALKRNMLGGTTDLKTEAANQAKCANAGLCPKVYYSSDTEFIMDKLDLPVYKLLDQYKDPVVSELIVRSIFDLLDQLHQIGLVHGDLHLGNIMVKDQNPNVDPDQQLSEIERYNQHDYRYYFIDLDDDEVPITTNQLDYLLLADWDRLILNLTDLERPYLDSIISEKIHQLVDVSVVDTDTGVTNLMILVINGMISYPFLWFLLQNISPEIINWQDHEGNTILHHLAALDHTYKIPTYKILIDAGADPKIRNHGGFLPVDYEQNPEDRKFLEGL